MAQLESGKARAGKKERVLPKNGWIPKKAKNQHGSIVLGSELVLKGSLPAIKKIQVSSAVVALAVDCCCTIVGCYACEGDIVESAIAEHA